MSQLTKLHLFTPVPGHHQPNQTKQNHNKSVTGAHISFYGLQQLPFVSHIAFHYPDTSLLVPGNELYTKGWCTELPHKQVITSTLPLLT